MGDSRYENFFARFFLQKTLFQVKLSQMAKKINWVGGKMVGWSVNSKPNERHQEKTCFLHMQKQRRRSAVQ